MSTICKKGYCVDTLKKMLTPLYARCENVALMRSATERTRGGGAYFGKDILGSVRSATDEYGSLEDRYEYDAFGIPYSGDFSTGLGAGYTGKAYDPVTGLYNYGYRDYSPSVARFTTVDPIRDGANWFSYVNNDPVNWVDEWGLAEIYANDINGKPVVATQTNKAILNARFEQTSLRVSQNELRPEKPSGPCLFRVLLATAEEKTNNNLNLQQMKKIEEELHKSGAIGNSDEFYFVKNPDAVVQAALTQLGYPKASVKVGYQGESTGKADYTLRFIKSIGHYQLGDSSGNLLWEPYAYNNPDNAFKGEASSLRDVTINLKGK